jgi:capsular polysaccharide biosynthesis protein
MLPPGPDRVVVLLAHPSQRALVRDWLAWFPHDRVHVIAPANRSAWRLEPPELRHHHTARTVGKLSAVVRKLPPVDIVVTLLSGDLLPGGVTDQLDLYDRLMRFLRKGGAYVLDRDAAGPDAEGEQASWLHVLAAAQDDAAAVGLDASQVQLAQNTSSVMVAPDLVVARKAVRHYVKLRHAGLVRLLHRREPELDVSVLAKLEAGSTKSRASVFHHGWDPDPAGFPELIEHPRMDLRHYRGHVGIAGGGLLYTGHSILPDSFRWHLKQSPHNSHIKSESPLLARIPPRFVPTRRLEGHHYFLDCIHSAHFGHVMTEMVCRLWGWELAKRQLPDLKAVFYLPPRKATRRGLVDALLTAYGIDPSDVVLLTEPSVSESVVSAMPMWHNATPYHAHPRLTETWEQLADGLLRQASDAEAPERIFVSRSEGLWRRSCRNMPQVEAVFGAHGFTVVRPEELPLGDQAKVFGNARVIAGFGGSAMFNLTYAQKAETFIVLNHESYTHRNEHLFTSLLGGDVHYFWSPADVAHPPGGFSKRAFQSAWEFDFDRNGAELERLLRSL